MWMENLARGVLRVLTPLGPRYLKPTFLQRVYLLWIFRHFHTLPVKVLSGRQLRMVEGLCARERFVALPQGNGVEAPILGTLEQRPPVEAQSLPQRRSAGSVSDAVVPFAADLQQRS